MPQISLAVRLLLAVVFATMVASAQAQTPPDSLNTYSVPFGSSGNVIELEVAAPAAEGTETENVYDVAVASAPAWLQFHTPRQTAEGEIPIARLGFDVARTAPVGETAEIVLHVVTGESVVGSRVIRLAVAAPTDLSLGAPYPNPSRGAVAVPFEVPSEGQVRLVAYDVLGREVAVLLDGERDAGAHEVTLDTGALAAGVYMIRLASDGREVRVRRLTVVR